MFVLNSEDILKSVFCSYNIAYSKPCYFTQRMNELSQRMPREFKYFVSGLFSGILFKSWMVRFQLLNPGGGFDSV